MSNNRHGLNRKGVPRKCSILGLKFDSHQQRNKYFGLQDHSIDLIEKRLKRGWTEEEAVGVAPPPNRARDKSGKPKPSTYKMFKEIDGTIYPDAPPGEFKIYQIICKENEKEYIGLTIQSLRDRLRGHFNEAFKTESSSKFHRAIRKYGKHNFTIHLIRCDAMNYKEAGNQEVEEINKRNSINLGYNTSFGGDIGTSKKIMVGPKLFISHITAAHYHNIDPRNFNQRISKLGWTPEEAAGLVKRPKYQHHVIEIEDKIFLSLKRAAEEYGLDYKTVFARKERQWTIKQMFGLDPPPNDKQMVKAVCIGNFKFESQAAFARHLGVSPSLVTKLKSSLSLEQIYEMYNKKP
jgi:group I intron endonuclease